MPDPIEPSPITETLRVGWFRSLMFVRAPRECLVGILLPQGAQVMLSAFVVLK